MSLTRIEDSVLIAANSFLGEKIHTFRKVKVEYECYKCTDTYPELVLWCPTGEWGWEYHRNYGISGMSKKDFEELGGVCEPEPVKVDTSQVPTYLLDSVITAFNQLSTDYFKLNLAHSALFDEHTKQLRREIELYNKYEEIQQKYIALLKEDIRRETEKLETLDNLKKLMGDC
ncbi:MAG TPA: hypothetical protein VEP90_06520 [Methylomirabilota bacterium]|nr:hypothetical protein [Methylomirabilota bacterium]